MTATKEQIVAEAERRWEHDPVSRDWSVTDYIIQVVREGWVPPPVDPDVLVVREIVAKGWGEMGLGLSKAETAARVTETLAGSCDTYLPVRAALAAYRAGREAEEARLTKLLLEPAEAIINRVVKGRGPNDTRWPHILKAARRLEKGLTAYKG
jgi:hypothetical protein